MMKINRQVSTLIFVSIILSSTHISASNLKKVAQSGMQYLKIGVDAQMVGRGEAGISLASGASSVFWNPAGIAEIKDKETFFSHNAWIADISLDALAFGINMGNWGALAFDALWVDYGDLLGTSVGHTVEESSAGGYIDEGTFNPLDLAIGVAYSRKISNEFSVGGHVRYLYEDYGSNTVLNTDGTEAHINNTLGAVSFDIGTWYNTGFKSLALSMVIQHFSPDIKYEYESFSPPLTFKMGVSMDVLNLFHKPTHSHLILAVDALHPRDYTERLNVGMEYSYLGLFQLRSGYRFNYDEGGFAIGGGFHYSFFDNMQIRLDVSYISISSGRFSSPMQISTSIAF